VSCRKWSPGDLKDETEAEASARAMDEVMGIKSIRCGESGSSGR